MTNHIEEDLLEALKWTLKVLDKAEECHPGSIHRYLSVAGEQRWKEARYFAKKAEGRHDHAHE